MSVFEEMIGTIFDHPEMGLDATYEVAASGVESEIRVMRRQADEITGLGGSRIRSRVCVLDVLSSDIAEPKSGDSVTIGGAVYTVKTARYADGDRLIWIVECYEGDG